MPLYEYECPECHARVEKLRRYDQRDEQVACEACALGPGLHGYCVMQRVASASNWQFGEGPKESAVSRAIGRVKKAEREGRLDRQ